MDKKKVIYIGILMIITVIVSIAYFSYAFFTHKSEQHGKLNIVAGTLNYKIESDDLTNNQITLEAGEVKRIEIELTSLNDINSKYELYYETDNNSIKVGYDTDGDLPIGTINANSKKTLTINLKNYSTTTSGTVTFTVEGGFTSNPLAKSKGTSIPTSSSLCSYTTNQVFVFAYNGTNGTDGSAQKFDTDFCEGTYKLEVWGAQGGSSWGTGGLGGYSYGNIVLTNSQKLNIYVGGQPSVYTIGGYNGGGIGRNSTSSQVYISSGGGATDIRLNDSSLENRVIVAGGGGGGTKYLNDGTPFSGGTGGGLTSGYVYYQQGSNVPVQSKNIGANQEGTYINNDTFNFTCGTLTVTAATVYPGALGQGSTTGRGGGGGGYYGGASFGNGCLVYSGGGGSGYIGGVTNASTTAGQKSGHGYACITYLGN